VNGRSTTGFRLRNELEEVTIWVDDATGLPARVEVVARESFVPARRVVMSDFTWDIAVDPLALVMTPPSDYQTQSIQLNFSPPTEQDLVEFLRGQAVENSGRFPKELPDVVPHGRFIAPRGLADLRDRMEEMQSRRGPLFIEFMRRRGEWKYVGGDVALGAPNTLIASWRAQPGGMGRRGVFADLSVRDLVDEHVQPAAP
jgi:hypothetical protein